MYKLISVSIIKHKSRRINIILWFILVMMKVVIVMLVIVMMTWVSLLCSPWLGNEIALWDAAEEFILSHPSWWCVWCHVCMRTHATQWFWAGFSMSSMYRMSFFSVLSTAGRERERGLVEAVSQTSVTVNNNLHTVYCSCVLFGTQPLSP